MKYDVYFDENLIKEKDKRSKGESSLERQNKKHFIFDFFYAHMYCFFMSLLMMIMILISLYHTLYLHKISRRHIVLYKELSLKIDNLEKDIMDILRLQFKTR